MMTIQLWNENPKPRNPIVSNKSKCFGDWCLNCGINYYQYYIVVMKNKQQKLINHNHTMFRLGILMQMSTVNHNSNIVSKTYHYDIVWVGSLSILLAHCSYWSVLKSMKVLQYPAVISSKPKIFKYVITNIEHVWNDIINNGNPLSRHCKWEQITTI